MSSRMRRKLQLHLLLFLLAVFTLTAAFRTHFLFNNVTEKTKDETNSEDTLITTEKKGIPLANKNSLPQETLIPPKDIVKMISDHLTKVTDKLPKEVNNIEKAIEIFNNTVKQINKTAQIIQLTAQYINISASFVMNTLNEYMTKINETLEIKTKRISNMYTETMSTIKKHINSSLEDLKLKSLLKPTTVEDILFSISYHLVSAFQDMTNLVVSSLPMNSAQKIEKAIQTEDVTKAVPKIEIFIPQEEYVIEEDVKVTETKNEPLHAKTLLKIPIPVHLGSASLINVLAPQNNSTTKAYVFDLNFCGNMIRPICGVDVKLKKYIIFINDCKRIVYNQLHNTSYIPFGMDICMGLFLKNPNMASHFVPVKQRQFTLINNTINTKN